MIATRRGNRSFYLYVYPIYPSTIFDAHEILLPSFKVRADNLPSSLSKMAGEWRSRHVTSTHFTDQPIEYILNPIDIWLWAILVPAELTAITTYIFRFLALNHFMIHGYVIQFLGMFFWCISSMDERLRIGGLCLFCGGLANHAWWTLARKSSEFIFGWEKNGKDPSLSKL